MAYRVDELRYARISDDVAGAPAAFTRFISLHNSLRV